MKSMRLGGILLAIMSAALFIWICEVHAISGFPNPQVSDLTISIF